MLDILTTRQCNHKHNSTRKRDGKNNEGWTKEVEMRGCGTNFRKFLVSIGPIRNGGLRSTKRSKHAMCAAIEVGRLSNRNGFLIVEVN